MQIYLVGGAVRDQLLQRSVKERDYVVVGATEKQMLAQGFTRVGKDFPVFLHPKTKEEYALARTERKKGFGYSGFECHASPTVTLEQDLLRRDLTINAIAMTEDQQLIDPYQGQRDLEQRIFRHVSKAFAEDPLRVFRIARFMARYHSYGFQIAPETMRLMESMCSAEEMQAISAERIWQETARALLEPAPLRYFQVLQDAGALTFWFAEWCGVDFYSKSFSQLVAADALQTLEQRFAVLCCLIASCDRAPSEPLADLNTLRERLKLPNSVFNLAKLALNESQRWGFVDSSNTDKQAPAQQHLSAEQLVDGFDQIDLWRNPQRLTEILTCLQFMYPSYSARIDTINACAKATLEINVQTIIADGHRGAEIKAALRSARLALIQAKLDQPST